MFLEHLAQFDWTRLVPADDRRRRERIGLSWRVSYRVIPSNDQRPCADQHGTALLINCSSEGLLLVMENAPEPEQVMKVLVPTPSYPVTIPTLAEVRWVEPVPLDGGEDRYLVGVKFIL